MLHLDTLTGKPADFLPQHETAACEPFNRYTFFKKIKGAGLKRLQFQPYQPVENLVGYRDFIVYFEKNSGDCSFEDISGIVKLLNDSSYTIRKAKISAFASVEGNEQINLRLQQERAQVMTDLLRLYNGDSIEIVGFQTAENWEMFYGQIKGTKYQSWSDSTREQIKTMLAEPGIAESWENLLARQRKAVLQLQLFRKADTTQQLTAAILTYKRLISQYISLRLRQQNPDEESLVGWQKRIMAVDDFLKRMVRLGKLPVEEFDQLQSYADPAINLIRFYSMMNDDTRRLSNVYPNRELVITKAYEAILGELYSAYRKPRQKYLLSQAIDIQIHVFEQIDAGGLTPEVACGFHWPKEAVFYPLILNELDYINRKPKEFIRALDCYRVDSTENEETVARWKENPHAISFDPPLDYRLPHTGYYFFLKKGCWKTTGICGDWLSGPMTILNLTCMISCT